MVPALSDCHVIPKSTCVARTPIPYLIKPACHTLGRCRASAQLLLYLASRSTPRVEYGPGAPVEANVGSAGTNYHRNTDNKIYHSFESK
jgi:hypothetical protein